MITWSDSLSYAILVPTVLFSKHVDKHDSDKGIRTLPVLPGKDKARLRPRWIRAGVHDGPTLRAGKE